MTTSTSNKKYFDLITSGVGKLHRYREVPVTRGDNFHAVDISVNLMRGGYTTLDCRICDADALAIVKQFIPSLDAGKTIEIEFNVGDLYPHPYLKQSGNHTGEPGAVGKVHLLKIWSVVVDGEIKYGEPQPLAGERPLITRGIGYLKRVDGKRRQVDICSIHGEQNSENMQFTWFNDCPILVDADPVIQKLESSVKEGKKVLVGFRLSDVSFKPFLYRKGENEGKPGTSTTGDLSSIDWAKVDGETVYSRPKLEAEACVPSSSQPTGDDVPELVEGQGIPV